MWRFTLMQYGAALRAADPGSKMQDWALRADA